MVFLQEYIFSNWLLLIGKTVIDLCMLNIYLATVE